MSTLNALKDQIARTLASLVLDRNDASARLKVKNQLESSITGSVVTMFPVNTEKPSLVQGTLNHEDLHETLHFQLRAPAADICLVCGEALEYTRPYGCVAGIGHCPYEELKC